MSTRESGDCTGRLALWHGYTSFLLRGYRNLPVLQLSCCDNDGLSHREAKKGWAGYINTPRVKLLPDEIRVKWH